MADFSVEALAPAQQLKRKKILQATLGLLSERGFHGFSIKQVASEAGVATGTVYLYFRDRQDLIEQLHMAIIEDVVAVTFADWDEQAPAIERYRAYCHRLWDYCIAQPAKLLCKGQFDQLPSDVLRNQYSIAKNLFAPLNTLFEQGKGRGDILDVPNEALFCLSTDTILDLARKHILGLVEVDEQVIYQVIEATWRGISTH